MGSGGRGRNIETCSRIQDLKVRVCVHENLNLTLPGQSCSHFDAQWTNAHCLTHLMNLCHIFRLSLHLVKHPCGAHGGGERRLQGFGWEARR
jgi:hypothetical protein